MVKHTFKSLMMQRSLCYHTYKGQFCPLKNGEGVWEIDLWSRDVELKHRPGQRESEKSKGYVVFVLPFFWDGIALWRGTITVHGVKWVALYRSGIIQCCKRPIPRLTSSEILTPHPPPPLVRGEDTLAGGRGGGGH